jgi:predicted Rossmann-fold nucleotide-binding protein
MRQHRGRVVDVETLVDFDRQAALCTRIAGWHVQSLDLRDRRATLARLDVAGALFLGCTFAEGDEEWVRARGAIVFPQVPGVPVDTYRTTLYSAEDLYDAVVEDRPGGYAAAMDARAYAWAQGPADVSTNLARALHDHAVDQALIPWAAARTVAGVMGGHRLPRGSDGFRRAATLGHLLGAAGLTVATGGGPGAMEAANLGARLSGAPPAALEEAVEALAAVPSYRPSVDAWVRTALAVRARWPDARESLGVPTWHYGHEPPNAFPTAIAKYFRNSTREAVLLEVCDAGIVFLPGAAGTVQELFQDACENYYAGGGEVAPMVLVGRHHWTRDLPAWPLLVALARERDMEQHVHLVDTVEQAAALLTG